MLFYLSVMGSRNRHIEVTDFNLDRSDVEVTLGREIASLELMLTFKLEESYEVCMVYVAGGGASLRVMKLILGSMGSFGEGCSDSTIETLEACMWDQKAVIPRQC